MKLEVKKIGNSTGLILPKELLTRLRVRQGQWLHVTELPGGGVRLTPHDPAFEQAMDTFDDLLGEYRDTLATLAK